MYGEAIAVILEEAARAPSGDNTQPWRVAVHGTTIELYNRPERDTSLYNWDKRAAYVAHGAFLENAARAGGVRGYRADITMFPEGTNSSHVATVDFLGGTASPDPLADAIPRRATNRKPYRVEPLSREARAALEGAVKEAPAGVTARFVEDRSAIERMARAAAKNEEVLFGNRSMHGFFFGHINWNRAEDEKKKIGFHVDTLELPPPARILFPLWKRWPVMRIFAALGFPKVVAKENALLYGAASCFAVITMRDVSPESYCAAGRLLERLWLVATSQGLSVQPLTGIAFLYHAIKNGAKDRFTPAHVRCVEEAYRTIADAVALPADRSIALIARIGKSDPPTARTSRVSLEALLAP